MTIVDKAQWIKNGIVKRVSRPLLPAIVRARPFGLQLTRLGEGDGAWMVPLELIDKASVCYCVGIGVNATFDLALAARTGCHVCSFDPTPCSIEYMAPIQADLANVRYLPLGIWERDQRLRFFAPGGKPSSNYSIMDLHGTGRFVEADVVRLSTAMKLLGHTRVHLLKLDIEGAWNAVLRNIVAEGIELDVLCVEFDSPTSALSVRSAVHLLKQAHLIPVYQRRENCVFVRQQLLGAH